MGRYRCQRLCGDDQVLRYSDSQRGRNHDVLNTGQMGVGREYCSHVAVTMTWSPGDSDDKLCGGGPAQSPFHDTWLACSLLPLATILIV